MIGSANRLTAKQFQESGGVEDWRVLAFGANAWFDAPSHAAGAALVRQIAELADSVGPMPDVNPAIDPCPRAARTAAD